MMASWQGSSNPVPILEKIYRDLHDIKLHLMPSYAEREGANEAFPAAAAAGAGAAAVRALKMLAGAAAAGAEAEWIHKIISGKRFLWNPSNNHLYYMEADGSQGSWAGLYNPETGKIDNGAPEPEESQEASSIKGPAKGSHWSEEAKASAKAKRNLKGLTVAELTGSELIPILQGFITGAEKKQEEAGAVIRESETEEKQEEAGAVIRASETEEEDRIKSIWQRIDPLVMEEIERRYSAINQILNERQIIKNRGSRGWEHHGSINNLFHMNSSQFDSPERQEFVKRFNTLSKPYYEKAIKRIENIQKGGSRKQKSTRRRSTKSRKTRRS